MVRDFRNVKGQSGREKSERRLKEAIELLKLITSKWWFCWFELHQTQVVFCVVWMKCIDQCTTTTLLSLGSV